MSTYRILDETMTLDGLWTGDNDFLVRLYESEWHIKYPPNLHIYSAHGQVLKGNCPIIERFKALVLIPRMPRNKPKLFVTEIWATNKYDVHIFEGQISIFY